MVGRDADIDDISRLKSIAVGVSSILNVFGVLASLANCHDGNLGTEYGWNKVSASNVPDT